MNSWTEETVDLSKIKLNFVIIFAHPKKLAKDARKFCRRDAKVSLPFKIKKRKKSSIFRVIFLYPQKTLKVVNFCLPSSEFSAAVICEVISFLRPLFSGNEIEGGRPEIKRQEFEFIGYKFSLRYVSNF